MSSSSSDDVVAAYQELSTTNYIGWAAFVLPLYDWLLCLGQEVNLVWARPKARPGASLLYLLNRYPLMVSYIIAQFLYIPISNESCTRLGWTIILIQCLNLIAPAMFSCLRVYALTGKNKWLSCLTLILGLMPFIINTASLYQLHAENLPVPFNCSEDFESSTTWSLIAILLSRVPLIMSDIIVVVVTWQKTFKINWMSRDTPHGSKLHHVMFESGTVYFIILLCLNVLLILLNVFSLTNLSSIGYITIFIDPITSVLISHFILNLRSANEQLQASVSSSLISADLRFVGSPHLGDALAGPVHTYSIDELAADDSTIMPDDLLETQE